MTNLVANSYSLQTDWEERIAVTLCNRSECGQLLTSKFIHSATREKLQREHDKECHTFHTTRQDGKCTYHLSAIGENQEEFEQRADAFLAGLRKKRSSLFPSTTFVKNTSKSWKRIKDVTELYEPTGVMVGSVIAFTKPERPIYNRRDDGSGYELDHYEPEEQFTGQVWSKGHKPKSVWIVTDDQRAFLVHEETFNVLEEWKQGNQFND